MAKRPELRAMQQELGWLHARRRAIHYDRIDQILPGFWRWPDFTPIEIASKGNGSVLVDEIAMDRLQHLRDRWGQPIRLTSAYRDADHNASVGSEPGSYHRQGRAFDILCHPNYQPAMHQAALQAGFSGFGFYDTFIHVDDGPARTWGAT